MFRCPRVLPAALLVAGCATARLAPPVPTCTTPRDAADSLLAWQHDGSFDLAHATACVEAPPDAAPRLAVQLKQVLDARGLYVPVDTIPDDPDYTDDDGHAVVTPLPGFPLTLVRGQDGLWRYARSTMEQVPALYRATFSPVVQGLQEQLPPTFFSRVAGLYLWQIALALLLALAAGIAGGFARSVLHGRALVLARRAGVPLDDDAYGRTDLPLMLTAVFGVLSWGVPQLQLPISVSWAAVGTVDLCLRLSGIALALRGIDVVADVARAWSTRTASKLDDQLVPLLRSAANAAVLVAGAFVVLGLFVDVWKLVAGASVGGLIVGLAAQDTVKNFFGSLNVFVDRPFQIGDWVRIGDVEGVVEEVGFRSTRVRTFHNSQVTLPNSTITNANVDNLGRRPRRRQRFLLGLTYDTPPDLLAAYAQGVRAILAAHPHVQNSYEVHVHDLADSSIQILVYYHIVCDDWHTELATRAQNILEFLRLAEALGVSFAFPSTSVYVASTPDHPLSAIDVPGADALDSTIAAFGPGGTQARPEGPPTARSWSAAEVTERGA
ncbi:MAG: mechanosensitive ion channel family protein [Alphaproteobacteria bacterium]|nr:mechanosensitive ion channel family protein [Alphaproteobacteria bacterium]